MTQIHSIQDYTISDVRCIFNLALDPKNTDKLINLINLNNIVYKSNK